MSRLNRTLVTHTEFRTRNAAFESAHSNKKRPNELTLEPASEIFINTFKKHYESAFCHIVYLRDSYCPRKELTCAEIAGVLPVTQLLIITQLKS